MVRVRKIVAEVSGLRNSKVPPTEHAEFTEPSAEKSLPQNTQNSQNLLISGGALETSAPP